MLRLGLVEGTEGNASARDGDVFHITPSALPYRSMTVDDLVTLALDGTVVDGTRAPSSELRVHVAVYAARPRARALVHTHSPASTRWSATGAPLGDVLTAPFAPSGSEEIAVLAVEALGSRDAVLLGGHGVLALGDTPAAALAVCAEVERAALQAGQ